MRRGSGGWGLEHVAFSRCSVRRRAGRVDEEPIRLVETGRAILWTELNECPKARTRRADSLLAERRRGGLSLVLDAHQSTTQVPPTATIHRESMLWAQRFGTSSVARRCATSLGITVLVAAHAAAQRSPAGTAITPRRATHIADSLLALMTLDEKLGQLTQAPAGFV